MEELVHVLSTLICVFLLQLWVKIVDGDIQDSTRSDLYEYIVDFLTFCPDQELVWKYSEWILQKNEEVCDWHIFHRTSVFPCRDVWVFLNVVFSW